jgi:hypothetical protein
MTIINTKQVDYDESRIAIDYEDTIPAEDVTWLVNLLEALLRSGQKLATGDLIQVGWMLLRLSTIADGAFSLTEPDMHNIPIQWRSGVTETLRQLRIQKDIVESLGMVTLMQIPSIRDSALLGVDVKPNEDNIILERAKPNGLDSGWFIGRLSSQLDYKNPKSLRRVSLYEAAIHCSAAVMFLSLPTGTKVEYSRDNISIWLDGTIIRPNANSFLSRLVNS